MLTPDLQAVGSRRGHHETLRQGMGGDRSGRPAVQRGEHQEVYRSGDEDHSGDQDGRVRARRESDRAAARG